MVEEKIEASMACLTGSCAVNDNNHSYQLHSNKVVEILWDGFSFFCVSKSLICSHS